MRRAWSLLAWLGVGAVFAAALGAVLFGVAPRLERLAEPPRDALFDGFAVPDDAALGGWLTRRAQALAARPAFLDTGRGLEATSFAALGLELDVAGAAVRVRALPRRASFGTRLRRAFGPPRAPAALEPRFRFDPERARALLAGLAAELDEPAVDARLEVAAHRRVPHQFGRRLDVDASLAQIERGGREDSAVFRLVFTPLEPSVKSEALLPVDVSRVLASFTTDFAKKAGARAVNIARAASFLNGRVLGPGELLSFNRVVGARSEARGFVWAPVIVNDELESGLGGGVCQVASTLHAAAVYGGLDVVERRSHSRPSGYAPLGLDATVIEDKVDLRLRNPYDVPLMLHAFLPTRTTLRIELLGREPPGEVKHDYFVVERHGFSRRVVERSELASGTIKRHQKGTYGYDVVSVVRTALPDGNVEVHRYRSKYWPVPEVYWVAPATPLAELPPLPDGAIGVESDAPGEEPEPDPV